ncbi:MAG: DNA replication/repair protein RecF [Alphaproteobacteria bacterium]|nr:DNA replication/repair protein RecF [Alphaproteobacteria bacterium]
MSLFLHKINISQFRNYEAARLDITGTERCPSGIVVLTGPNGAGKTNILEAISLLVPGNGLRRAAVKDMKNRATASEDIWAVSAEVETAQGLTVRIGTGLDRETRRRIVRINGKDIRRQSDLSGFVSAVWLTPQMDRLFLEGSSARRRFLDRLVFAYEPDHITRINRYNKTMRERMKLLQLDKPADPRWLSGLETQMSAAAVSAAASRIALLQKLQQHADTLDAHFPRPHLEAEGWVENELTARPAVDVEEDLKNKLAAARTIDRTSGRTSNGIHRCDLRVLYAEKNIPAALSSTGEQKALLVSIILAHALMMQAEKGFVPIILLDEVAAHLDEVRRRQLFSRLLSLKGQIWLTGTDETIFSSMLDTAKHFRVDHGHIATTTPIQKFQESRLKVGSSG